MCFPQIPFSFQNQMMKEPAEHLYIFLIVTFDILQPHVCRQALDLTVLDRCVRLEQLSLGLQVQPASVCSLVAPTCMFLMSQHQPSCSLSLESEATECDPMGQLPHFLLGHCVKLRRSPFCGRSPGLSALLSYASHQPPPDFLASQTLCFGALSYRALVLVSFSVT